MEDLAQRAYMEAARANQRIDDHEKTCSERYHNINGSIKELRDVMKSIPWKIITILGAIITILGGTVIGLIIYIFEHLFGGI